MRSVQYFGNGVLKLVDIPEPQCTHEDDVKIRVAYSGVCGSDLHYKRAEMDFFFEHGKGTSIGHEATGTVVELGPCATAKGLRIGDHMTYYYNEHCGNCYYCRNGQEQFCTGMTGTTAAMSDYIVVREQSVYKLEQGCSLKKGVLVEPISVSLHGIDLARIKMGTSVAISGGGAMEFFAALYRRDYDYKINLLNAFFKEINIIGGVFQSPYCFPRSVALAEVLDIDALLVDGCVFDPEDFEEAFKAQMDSRTIKSLIRFDPEA